jgi:hypothetical protein
MKIHPQYTAKYFQVIAFRAMGFTYVEKNPAPRPKNCSIAMPLDLSAKGNSSTRYAMETFQYRVSLLGENLTVRECIVANIVAWAVCEDEEKHSDRCLVILLLYS